MPHLTAWFHRILRENPEIRSAVRPLYSLKEENVSKNNKLSRAFIFGVSDGGVGNKLPRAAETLEQSGGGKK